jgi:MFS transporter, FHS family, glucose/mannose:H+ symporter
MYNKKLVFSSAFSGMLLFGVGLITLGAVAPGLKEKYHLDEADAGILFSILPIGILAGSLLFGPIADRYGYKWLMITSCLAMCLGFEGIAYAPSLFLLKVAIFSFGIGGGILNGATNAMVADISENAKGANLSLLGVFFGLGALGMPFILGLLKDTVPAHKVVAVVGWITLVMGLLYIFIRFPSSKKAQGFVEAKKTNLFKGGILLLISFYLFCQSSFESILNNWTTTYFTKDLSIPENRALFALSLYVVGLTVMRLLLGSIFRKIPAVTLQVGSWILMILGSLLLHFAGTYTLAVTGLILLGAGLAGGFPVMLGILGERFAQRSATAFSVALVIGLLGNMMVNYLMGVIADKYGIHYVTTVIFIELTAMIILGYFIFRSQQKLQTTSR